MKLLIVLLVIFFCSCHPSDVRPVVYPSGGYDFVVPGNDTFFSSYPLKKIMSRRDSFHEAYYGYYHFKVFNEENISLRPSPFPVFKLSFSETGKLFIITLTENELVIKKWNEGFIYPEFDESSLTKQESKLFNATRYHFPMEDSELTNLSPRITSLLKEYPQIASLKYLSYLREKATSKKDLKVVYTTQKFRISTSMFNRLINKVNAAGYWTLPYDLHCSNVPADAGGYSLEANIGTKYNVVSATICPDDSTSFGKACQEIVDAAGLGDEVQLTWNTKDSEW